jgi:5'-nucleotidase
VLKDGTDRLVGVYDVDALNAFMGANSPLSPVALGRISRVN